MKKLIAIFPILIILISTVTNVQAQSARSGIKGGLNFSNLYLDDVDDENARTGFHIGGFTQFMLSESVALQPELLYTTKGSKAEYDIVGFKGESKFNLSYLEVPMLLAFKLGEAAEIHAGMYGGYLLSANVSTENKLGSNQTKLDRDNFNAIDYGLVGGFAMNFGPLSGGVRYNYGLHKLASNKGGELLLGDAKNSVAQVYVALNLVQ